MGLSCEVYTLKGIGKPNKPNTNTRRETARKEEGEAAFWTISGRIRSVFLRDRRSSKSLGKFYKLFKVLNGLKTELEVVLVYGLERESRERDFL